MNANVILEVGKDEVTKFEEEKELLKTVFIVSNVDIAESDASNGDITIKVEPAKGEKCERCWTYSETVGEDKEHPTICAKCRKALED